MSRIVLVTGASRGLGKEIAKTFLDAGDIVYVNYNQSEKKAQVLAEEYSKARIIKCDVGNELEVKEMFRTIKEEHGQLDIVVNNAATNKDSFFYDKTKEEFIEVLNTNLIGPFLICKYAGELMLKKKSGKIINITSTNAIDTYETYSMDYDASKAGLISLTHNFAKALAPYVCVNAVASGWIKTRDVMEMDPHYIVEEEKKIMLERFAEVKEIADVVFFLASAKASYINSSVIRVDGGLK